MVRLDCSMFKLAIVIGASRTLGKTRVRTWQNSTRRWSAAFAIGTGCLGILPDYLSKITQYDAVLRRRVINRALESSLAAGAGMGWV